MAKEFKRKLKRLSEEIKASCEIAKHTSVKEAVITFIAKMDIQLMCRNNFKEPPNVKKRLLIKHAAISKYLDLKFKQFWDTYNISLTNNFVNKHSNKIWVCWWQGEENAPAIVKRCIESIRNNAGKYDVVVITAKNCKNYVDFPEHIKQKVEDGIISKTIYSDLLRINLLSQYGGIWLDSTFFATGDISQYVEKAIWSIKRPDYLHASIASGNFSNYSLGCSYQNRWIFKAVLDFLYNYWETNNYLIDYLLTDYAIVAAQRHFEQMASLIESIVPNNSHCDELWKILEEPFDSEIWDKITSDTNLFKLTWKSNFPTEVNGEVTFYGKLMNGSL